MRLPAALISGCLLLGAPGSGPFSAIRAEAAELEFKSPGADDQAGPVGGFSLRLSDPALKTTVIETGGDESPMLAPVAVEVRWRVGENVFYRGPVRLAIHAGDFAETGVSPEIRPLAVSDNWISTGERFTAENNRAVFRFSKGRLKRDAVYSYCLVDASAGPEAAAGVRLEMKGVGLRLRAQSGVASGSVFDAKGGRSGKIYHDYFPEVSLRMKTVPEPAAGSVVAGALTTGILLIRRRKSGRTRNVRSRLSQD